MNEVQKFNLRQAGDWLAGEIEVRVPKKWLAIGSMALVMLMLFAID